MRVGPGLPVFRAAALSERESTAAAQRSELPVTLTDLIPSSGPWHSTSLNFSLSLGPPLFFLRQGIQKLSSLSLVL